MHGKVELHLHAEDLIRTDEVWNEEKQRCESVVKFLGIEVGRYDEEENHFQTPPQYRGDALEARAEKIARVLWELGAPEEQA